MGTDPVVLALRAAIASEDVPALRVALGRHLLQAGTAKEALAEFEAALRLAPTDPDALAGAAEAAERSGDAARAAAYRLAAQPAARPKMAPVPTDSAAPATPHAAKDPPGIRLVAADGELLEESTPPAVTFSDVGGMEDVKARLRRSFLLPLQKPDLYKKFGKTIGGGLVLYGPPGCGKTFVARAVAGEIGARFVSIGLSDVLDMWLGESERKLHEVFENARRRAPTLLFFDEVDALGQRRTHLKHSAGRNVVNQFLAELDGIGGRNENVFVLGATNHPWDLDPALRRPGRFDRLLFVPAPDLDARARIVELKLAGRLVAEGIDAVGIARKTDGFSGADLQALVDVATELAIEETLRTGAEHPVDGALLAKALAEIRPSTRPWYETARNYAIYANEGGVYDDLLAELQKIGLG